MQKNICVRRKNMLTFRITCVNLYRQAAMAQEVAHHIGSVEVTGSNPVSSFLF